MHSTPETRSPNRRHPHPWSRRARAQLSQWFNHPPELLQRQFPQVLWTGDATQRAVALSYDDGPHAEDTPQLLEVLARHGVTATFCWLGERVAARPDLVRAAADAGHQIMVHGYRHRSFVLEAPHGLRQHLDTTRELIADAAGRSPAEVSYVRPPFGIFTPKMLTRFARWGYRPVIGSIVPVHWLQPSAASLNQIARLTRPGSLLVLHESQGGPAVADLTDAMLTQLAPRQYSYVTVDQMWRRRYTVDA